MSVHCAVLLALVTAIALVSPALAASPPTAPPPGVPVTFRLTLSGQPTGTASFRFAYAPKTPPLHFLTRPLCGPPALACVGGGHVYQTTFTLPRGVVLEVSFLQGAAGSLLVGEQYGLTGPVTFPAYYDFATGNGGPGDGPGQPLPPVFPTPPPQPRVPVTVRLTLDGQVTGQAAFQFAHSPEGIHFLDHVFCGPTVAACVGAGHVYHVTLPLEQNALMEVRFLAGPVGVPFATEDQRLSGPTTFRAYYDFATGTGGPGDGPAPVALPQSGGGGIAVERGLSAGLLLMLAALAAASAGMLAHRRRQERKQE